MKESGYVSPRFWRKQEGQTFIKITPLSLAPDESSNTGFVDKVDKLQS